jgi:hypothetical protein
MGLLRLILQGKNPRVGEKGKGRGKTPSSTQTKEHLIALKLLTLSKTMTSSRLCNTATVLFIYLCHPPRDFRLNMQHVSSCFYFYCYFVPSSSPDCQPVESQHFRCNQFLRVKLRWAKSPRKNENIMVTQLAKNFGSCGVLKEPRPCHGVPLAILLR